MEQREDFLTRLYRSKSSDTGGGCSETQQVDTQLMPPPVARPVGPRPPAGKRTMQQQAVLAAAQAATHTNTGPLGTILDDAPFDASEQVSTSAPASRSGLAQYAVSSWNDYFDSMQDLHLAERDGTFRVYLAGTQGPVVFCLHGGGYSGLTWALLAKQLKGRYRLLAMDQRGHGATTTSNDADLSADTLVQDAVAVWKHLFSTETPPIVIVGHSMGGAIAVRCAVSKAIGNVEGLVVIDVVEGTALASLPHMATVLKQRPTEFSSCEAAIYWARKSGMSKNSEAACVSIPSCLVQTPSRGSRWVWRTPLHLSQPYWEGWYQGLSDLFMTVKAPKVLVLAGTDRLDRSLTVGQMQGKFQLVLLPQAGHAVHEDQHERTAEVLSNFIQRFRIGQPKMAIPKAVNAGPPVLPVAAGPASEGRGPAREALDEHASLHPA